MPSWASQNILTGFLPNPKQEKCELNVARFSNLCRFFLNSLALANAEEVRNFTSLPTNVLSVWRTDTNHGITSFIYDIQRKGFPTNTTCITVEVVQNSKLIRIRKLRTNFRHSAFPVLQVNEIVDGTSWWYSFAPRNRQYCPMHQAARWFGAYRAGTVRFALEPLLQMLQRTTSSDMAWVIENSQWHVRVYLRCGQLIR